MRHFGIQSRRAPSGAVDGHSPAFGARNTGAGPYSFPRSPSEMMFHPENIPYPPFEIAARLFFALFVFGLISLFVSAYYGAWFLFGV